MFPAPSPRPGPGEGEQRPACARRSPRRGLSVQPARWAEALHAHSADLQARAAMLRAWVGPPSMGVGKVWAWGGLRPAGVT